MRISASSCSTDSPSMVRSRTSLDRHQARELILNLLDNHFGPGGDDGDARQPFFGIDLGYREAFDVVAAP